MRVLIVDDSQTIVKLSRKVVQDIFKEANFVSFNNPLEAIKVLENETQKIDFALLDYNMNEMTGVDLAHALIALKNQLIGANRIAIVSANVQEKVMEKAKQIGLEFVAKPFDATKFNQLIVKWGMNNGGH